MEETGLHDLSGAILGEIMKTLSFQDCIRITSVSKDMKDKIVKENILHPFLLALHAHNASISAYDPLSCTWHKFSGWHKLRLVGAVGDFLYFRKFANEDISIVIMNVRTQKKEVISCPCNFFAIQMIVLATKFKIICTSKLAKGSVQAWVYDSSVGSWEGKAEHDGVLDDMDISFTYCPTTHWDDKVWVVLSRSKRVLVYHISQDMFSLHKESEQLSHYVINSSIVCCASRLFLIGQDVLEVTIYEIDRIGKLHKVSSFKGPAMPFLEGCSDGVRRIWMLGNVTSGRLFKKSFLEFDICSRNWTWLPVPNDKQGALWPIGAFYSNLQLNVQ